MKNNCKNSPFLDTRQEIDVNRSGYLPHWEQEAKIQFVTMRLTDSMPQSILKEVRQRIASFEHYFPKPWDEETNAKYMQIVNGVDEYLDKGYGYCVLRSKDIRDELIEVIEADIGLRFDLLSGVIMPNHIHLLMKIYPGETLQEIMSSMKSISSHRINKRLGRSGRLWQHEYFDRIIRDEKHLETCIAYIRQNPKHLPSSDYSLI